METGFAAAGGGILDGLVINQRRGYTNVLIHTDSLKVVKLCRIATWLVHPQLWWTSTVRTQDGKTLKRLQNSTGRTGSSTAITLGSTDTTQTSICRTYSSKQGSFGLGLLSIP
ncbi:hypothetical protein Gotur_030513 [Gossypium turneri]